MRDAAFRLSLLLVLALSAMCATSELAADPGTRLIRLQVTSAGLVTSDVPIVNKTMVLPKGTRVRLVLIHADQYPEAHQFMLVSTGQELTTAVITPDAKTATLEFVVGQHGEMFYRLSCALPCIAMDQLVDYIIQVGQPSAAGASAQSWSQGQTVGRYK